MVKRFAKLRGEGEHCVENLSCKMGRGKVTIEGRRHYVVLPSEMDGHDKFFEETLRSMERGDYPSDEQVVNVLKRYGDVFFPGQMVFRRVWSDPNNEDAGVILLCGPLSGGDWVVQELEDPIAKEGV